MRVIDDEYFTKILKQFPDDQQLPTEAEKNIIANITNMYNDIVN